MSYHIEMDSYRRIGWVTLVVWIAGAIGAFYGSQPRTGAVLIAFGLLPTYILLDAGSYDLDDEGSRNSSVEWPPSDVSTIVLAAAILTTPAPRRCLPAARRASPR